MDDQTQENKGEIIIYDAAQKGSHGLEVKLQDDTVWLSQKQMAALFDKDVNTIGEHIQNIFHEHELSQDATTRKFREARKGRYGSINAPISYYNLDVIISVGYRVKSLKGTQFRIWATQVLRDHIVKGFTINRKRLEENAKRLKELQNNITFLQKAIHTKELDIGEAKGLLEIISEYTRSWIILNQYDESKLNLQKNHPLRSVLTYEACLEAITQFKESLIAKQEASSLFGIENEAKFQSIIGIINQSLYGKDVYNTIEEKAAHLLYFVIKDHPFTDGNKRIASMLFIYFLKINNFLYKESGEVKINDNTLVAIALLIAISNPTDKDTLIKLITNLL